MIVTDADSVAETNRLATSLWLSGLAALVLVLGGAGYLVTRAISRELEVARLQSDFVAAVSHEFRTPLTSLRQLTEILVDERVVDDNRRRAYYGALARQTDRLHRLVESLLDFGRLEAGDLPTASSRSTRARWSGPWSRNSRRSTLAAAFAWISTSTARRGRWPAIAPR